jgi:hypothetical protein
MTEHKIYPLAWLYSTKKKAKSPYCTVRVSATRKDMVSDILSMASDDLARSDLKNLDGYFIGYVNEKKSPLGHIFISVDNYSPGLVAHEAVHMAALYYRTFYATDSFSIAENIPEVGVEEFMAYTVGAIVNQVGEICK